MSELAEFELREDDRTLQPVMGRVTAGFPGASWHIAAADPMTSRDYPDERLPEQAWQSQTRQILPPNEGVILKRSEESGLLFEGFETAFTSEEATTAEWARQWRVGAAAYAFPSFLGPRHSMCQISLAVL